MSNPFDLVSTKEACDILGYADPSSISRLVITDKLTPAKKMDGIRGAFLFFRHDVERLAKELRGAA